MTWVALWAAFAANAEAPLVDVRELEPRWVLDIKYATTDNFTGKRLYPLARCLLRPAVAGQLLQAQRWLDAKKPGYVLLLKDCYRPESIQKIMWEVVRGTPKQAYVANPNSKTGSVHNYGAAVDLSLAKDGHEVDMGTPYDYLGELAEPRREERFLGAGQLSRAQVDHRHLLRDAMVLGGGFRSIPNEWWHFDALQGAQLRARYDKLDLPFDAALNAPTAK